MLIIWYLDCVNSIVDWCVRYPGPFVDEWYVEHAVDQAGLAYSGRLHPTLNLFRGHELVPVVGTHRQQTKGVLGSKDCAKIWPELCITQWDQDQESPILFLNFMSWNLTMDTKCFAALKSRYQPILSTYSIPNLVVLLIVVTKSDPPGTIRFEHAWTNRGGFSTCSITSEATTASNFSPPLLA